MSVETNYNSLQKNNINVIIETLQNSGITNPALIAGILAVVMKETNFILKPETGYNNTDNLRIRSIFSKTRPLTDQQLTNLKKNPKAFFNFVYGNLFGNGSQDGYLYRGRGYNGITFKQNYIQASQDTGVNLVANPDLLNDPKIAAKALAGYYKRNYPKAIKSGIYSANENINSINNPLHAYLLAFGITKGKHTLNPIDTTGGYNKGRAAFPDLLDYVKKKKLIQYPGWLDYLF